MCVLLSLLVLRVGCGMSLCYFLIITFLFTVHAVASQKRQAIITNGYNQNPHPTSKRTETEGHTQKTDKCSRKTCTENFLISKLVLFSCRLFSLSNYGLSSETSLRRLPGNYDNQDNNVHLSLSGDTCNTTRHRCNVARRKD